jgi:uncharacterized protein (TIGR03086 family)
VADLVGAHRSALLTSAAIVDGVQLDHLDRPTPCGEWSLRDLLAHMIGQNYGFADAIDGQGGDPAVFADVPVGEWPAADYQSSVDRVVSAFGTPGALEREVEVAVLRGGVTLPGSQVIGFHLVDYVVHGWDVARSIGVVPLFDRTVLQIALEVAEAVPDRARSQDAQAPFRPTVPTASADLLDRIVANLGRSPDWAP